MPTSASIAGWCRKHPVIAYCLLAFSITWGIKLWYASVTASGNRPAINFGLIASYGPSLAAVILIALTQGSAGLRRTAQSMVHWRVGTRWLLLAALFEFVLFLSITLLYFLTHPEAPLPGGVAIVSGMVSVCVTFVVGLFRWGLPEEIGWRGWLQPQLQNTMSPFTTSLIMGVIITLWHIHPNSLPEIAAVKEDVYLIGHYPEVIERLIITIPITLVITYIYNNTQGSLLVMMIFHSSNNTSYFWLDEIFNTAQTEFFKTAFLVALVVIGVVFSLLVFRQRPVSRAVDAP